MYNNTNETALGARKIFKDSGEMCYNGEWLEIIGMIMMEMGLAIHRIGSVQHQVMKGVGILILECHHRKMFDSLIENDCGLKAFFISCLFVQDIQYSYQSR